MQVARRNSGAQRFVAGEKDDIRIVRGHRFGIVNRCQRAAERVVLD